MNIKTIAVVMCVVVSLSGCAQISKMGESKTNPVKKCKKGSKKGCEKQKAVSECAAKGAKYGAIAGGVTGGVTGLATGGVQMGAIGLGVGTAGGAAVGAGVMGIMCDNAATDKEKDTFNYDRTKERVKYNGKGTKFELETLTATPEVEAGEDVKLKANYYILTPNKKNDVVVTEEWIANGYSFGAKKRPIQQGDRTPEMDMPIPETAKPGKYTVTLKVTYKGKVMQKSANYVVTE